MKIKNEDNVNWMKVAILTSPNQWFVPYAEELQTLINGSELFYDHRELEARFDIVFILSYHKIIPEKYLIKHKHNIVIHESPLPLGKGWAPLFWQVLEDKNEITFSMFEASSGVDDGDIYMQKILKLEGHELNKELRHSQAGLKMDMCLEFLENYEKYKVPRKQVGKESFYPKRSTKDGELDVDRPLKEQFNLLRTVDNEAYPAFFNIGNYKYVLKIEKVESGSDTI